MSSQTQDKACTACRFKPLSDRVLVEKLASEEKLSGGIILPDSAKKKQDRAKVIACGPGKKTKDGSFTQMPVTPGQIVLMSEYSGQKVTIDEQEYVIVKADDLIAVVE